MSDDGAAGRAGQATVDEIVADLRRRILAGEWACWTKLPGQVALSARYGRKRQDGAVQRAMQHLHAEGLVIARQGTEAVAIHGRTMMPIVVSGRPWAGDDRVSEHMLTFGGGAQGRRFAERLTTVSPRLAPHAGIDAGTEVVERVVWLTVDRRAVAASVSLLPLELVSPEDGDAWHAVDIGGLAIVGHEAPPTRYRVRSELPGPDERTMLDLVPGTPMLVVSSQYLIGEPGVRAAVVVLADGIRVDLAIPPAL